MSNEQDLELEATIAEPEQVEESADLETVDSAPAPEHTEQDKIEKRIAKATYEKHQALRAAQDARREADELRQRIESGGTIEQGDIQAFVKNEAQRLHSETAYNDACNRTYDAGKAEFKDGFDKALQNLSLVGMNHDFLEIVSSTDVGPKILYHLGQDLDEAERISRLPPVQMARELTKLEIKLSSQKTKTVSKVPDPITPISGKSAGHKSPADMTDEEYRKWRKST